MKTVQPLVLPLDPSRASPALVGGKGWALAVLAAAGHPVPDAFLVTTRAYRDYVAANHLRPTIPQSTGTGRARLDATAAASAAIRTRFETGTLPATTVEAVNAAYTRLGDPPARVAVRSSATTEDRVGLSSAGLHESVLNVRGAEALWLAIRRCWASLWSARAIDYRGRMQADTERPAMAVVVQKMVDADVSGITFTVNPATGDRSELVINASFGLGEAIVGGHVTPDAYVVDRVSGAVIDSTVGAKPARVVSAPEGGTRSVAVGPEHPSQPALSPERVRELAARCLEVELLFSGVPQDIEWAVSQGRWALLQARPVTGLPPPAARWAPPSEGTVLIRRQVVENMPEPLSPLFEELYLSVGLEEAIDRFLVDFGLRVEDVALFLDRPMCLTVNGYAYSRASYRWSWRLWGVLPRILVAYVIALPRLLRSVGGRWRDEALAEYLDIIARWRRIDVGRQSDERLLEGTRALSIADASYWFTVSILVGAAKVTDAALDWFLTSRLVPGELRSGQFLRGFFSKTLEAQFCLESIAARIRGSEELRVLVRETPAAELLDRLSGHPSGVPIADAVRGYLDEFGHQIYNLDFVEPTQVEDPTATLAGLAALVERAPVDTAVRQRALVRERDALVARTSASLGPLRRFVFRRLLRWAQAAGPGREEALFYMGAAWSTLRRLALELGRRLVDLRIIHAREDVFFLVTSELQDAVTSPAGDLASDVPSRVERRRALRQTRRQWHPPGIIPEGARWRVGPIDMTAWETQKRNAVDAAILDGFGVSPGRVTGVATVIRSLEDFSLMRPDTILVCPTTTPAWTPLFAQATGLVTDIGGILAHGSIVAREYGIPAVLGTGTATQRIATGQRVAVDGGAGTVTLLDRTG